MTLGDLFALFGDFKQDTAITVNGQTISDTIKLIRNADGQLTGFDLETVKK
jgi:hypothetical protein